MDGRPLCPTGWWSDTALSRAGLGNHTVLIHRHQMKVSALSKSNGNASSTEDRKSSAAAGANDDGPCAEPLGRFSNALRWITYRELHLSCYACALDGL